MTSPPPAPPRRWPGSGRVVKLITDDELIINLGSLNNVLLGMVFEILDPATQDVIDPETGDNLGSIERIKAEVRVVSVSDRISLAAVHPSRGRAGVGIGVQVLMDPKPPSTALSGDTWPDGTKVGDLARFKPTLTPPVRKALWPVSCRL